MKILVGKDIGSYTFTPASGNITLSGLETINLEDLVLITNATSGSIIYNFASPTQGGSISSNVITLETNTSAMYSTDNLQILVEYGEPHIDFDIGAMKVSDISPLYNRYTDVETLVSAQNLTSSYADYGAEIDMRGYTHLGIFVVVDANDSQDAYMKALGKHTESGTEEFIIDGIGEIVLWESSSLDFNKYWEFDTGVIPYIQLQAYATTVGVTPGDLTIYITKYYRP